MTHHDKAVNEPPWEAMRRSLYPSGRSTQAGSSTTTQRPTIFQVRPEVRLLNATAFTPQIVSLGPYHRQKAHLKAMEDHKRRYFREFLERDPTKSLKEYFSMLLDLVPRARSCYGDFAVGIVDYDFTEMLLLDGVFILEFVFKVYNLPIPKGNEFDFVFDTLWTQHPVVYDLLRLENQIPFFVLNALYSLHVSADPSGRRPRDINIIAQHPFIDLVSHFLSNFPLLAESNKGSDPNPVAREGEIEHFLHFYHLTLTSVLRRQTTEHGVTSQPNKPQYVAFIPNAQELQEAGIKFKVKKDSEALLDISFNFKHGVLEMSPLWIYENTSTVLHNLVAFEQYYPKVGRYVTKYCHFIDCLIDTPADVSVLRQAKVMIIQIGSDEEAAQLANQLVKHAICDSHDLNDLYVGINTYCKSRWPAWRAKLVHDYFAGPWAIISLMAATLFLVLTILQVVFAVLAYVRPPG